MQIKVGSFRQNKMSGEENKPEEGGGENPPAK